MKSKSKKLMIVLLCIALAMTFSFTGSVFAEEGQPATTESFTAVENSAQTENAPAAGTDQGQVQAGETGASNKGGSESTSADTEKTATVKEKAASEGKNGETPKSDESASETTNTGEKGGVSSEEESNEKNSKETLPREWSNIANVEGREYGYYLNMDESRKLNVTYSVQNNVKEKGKPVADPSSHIKEQYVEFNGKKYDSLEKFKADRVGKGNLVTTWDNGFTEKDGFCFYTGITINYVDVDTKISFYTQQVPYVYEDKDFSNYNYSGFTIGEVGVHKDAGVYQQVKIDGSLSVKASDLTGHKNVTIYYKRYVTVSGVKTWDDENNKAKSRPDSITVCLTGGDKVERRTVTSGENWRYSFGNVPYYVNGVPVHYIISEEPVQNYTTRVEGFNIWNKYNPPAPYIPPTKTIRVSKVWVTDDGGTPAESVDVQILKNGEAYKVVTLSDANGWNYSEAVIDDGAKYTAQEVTSVDGFVSSVTEDGDTITITNDDVKKPDKPDKPDKPTKPDKPVKPDKPAKPSKPAKPKKPAVSVPVEQVKANVPKTGDENHMGLYGGMLVLAAAGAAVLLRLRRKSGK
ncbi:Cna B-type domain-containing protein [Eubacterium pyruvativorans]|uniref:Cna B-type domain-containing protein n=1 Tax=Eubacterium pyruvativorans TaxID=155865 RepID=UPI0023F4B088|nr:Cna B-type domain-containing protein [Eubacterium pyruvativorans]MCI5747167.1 Cna B-type domain-containing protein [Eubacterium pyruvativorans]MDD7684257.1 Cna B-type domain-containing protein [Eubacterium pyruvativorans]